MFVFLSKTWDLGRPTTLHATSYAGTKLRKNKLQREGKRENNEREWFRQVFVQVLQLLWTLYFRRMCRTELVVQKTSYKPSEISHAVPRETK